jgi:hypothetical protein
MKREDSDSEVANDEEPEGTSPPQDGLRSKFLYYSDEESIS